MGRFLAAVGASREHRAQRRRKHPANNRPMVLVGTVVMIAAALALFAGLVNLWPSVDTSEASGGSTHTVRLLFGAVAITVSHATALIILVILVGAVGSLIHAATSFGDFVGNERFRASWVVWYLLRLVVGSLLALLLYFAVRGGFFSGSSQASNVNPYGIAALAGLAGLFSKQATDKLREVFETMFRVSSQAGDAQRKDSLANPAPVVRAIEPTGAPAGSTNFVLHIRGDHFVKDVSTVKIDGEEHKPSYVSAQQLDVVIPDELLANPGSLEITVYTAEPGGGESKPAKTFTIA
jgi:hypothetical protein